MSKYPSGLDFNKVLYMNENVDSDAEVIDVETDVFIAAAEEDFYTLTSWTPLYKFVSCEYSFANLLMWGELYDIRWRNVDGVPLIYIAKDNNFLFPHIKNITPDLLCSLSEQLQREGYSGTFSQVPEEFVVAYPVLSEFFSITQNPDFSDYIHSTEKLAKLQGRKLRKKRNLVAQFSKENRDFQTSTLHSGFFDECLRLANDGLEQEITGKNEEIEALEKAFAMFDKLPLEGIVIHSGSKVIAFSIFSPHVDGTYVVHFEKNDRAYKGSAQVVNLKTAEYLLDKCEYINREQDLGLPGLRKAKLSYDPDTILMNYELTPLATV